jgi:PAS domain S-box-containing protein
MKNKKNNEHDHETLVFFQSIVDNVPDMIFVKEAKELRFVLFNKAGEELLGYPRKDMIGKNDYDFFPKNQADFFTAKDQTTLKKKVLLDIPEEPIQTRYKGLRFLHTKKIPILDDKGAPKYLLGISEDITEQKRTKEWLDVALKSARIGAWDLNLVTDNAERNLIHDQIFGYKTLRKKWSEKIFFRHIVAEDRPFVRQSFDAAMKTGRLYFDCRIMWPDKSIHWIEASGNVHYEGNKPLRMLGTVVDITRRKDLEKMLADKRAEEIFRILFDSAVDGIVLADAQTEKFIMANKAMCEQLGRNADEITKLGITDIHPKKDIPYARAQFKELAKGEISLVKNIPVKRKNDSIYYADISGAHFEFGGKNIMIGIFRDVTKEREIDRAKTEFVSIASHQLRTPLTSVKWYSEVLLKGKAGELNLKQVQFMGEIHRANERMIDLVKNLLDISRIEMGNIVVSLESIDIVELLKEVIKDQEPFINKKKQNVSAKISDDLPKVFTDRQLTRMVFQNLLGNAIEYTPHNGKIICTVNKEAKEVVIGIKDTGIGIPKKQQNQVFQKLFRGDNIVREHSEGVGLELYTTKAMVDALSGRIWFKSEEGKGTTFWVALPIAGPEVSSAFKK